MGGLGERECDWSRFDVSQRHAMPCHARSCHVLPCYAMRAGGRAGVVSRESIEGDAFSQRSPAQASARRVLCLCCRVPLLWCPTSSSAAFDLGGRRATPLYTPARRVFSLHRRLMPHASRLTPTPRSCPVTSAHVRLLPPLSSVKGRFWASADAMRGD
jgi:hypothetical protein